MNLSQFKTDEFGNITVEQKRLISPKLSAAWPNGIARGLKA